MKIYFATWLFEPMHGRHLTKKRANTRLLSFYFLKEQGITDEQLRLYIRTGRLNTSKGKK